MRVSIRDIASARSSLVTRFAGIPAICIARASACSSLKPAWRRSLEMLNVSEAIATTPAAARLLPDTV